MIYVASSWKNDLQGGVVHVLRAAGLEVYDFKSNDGFHWSEVSQTYHFWEASEFVEGLSHPAAMRGFSRDYEAMKQCDTCVLVLPCGKSAHLELGWFAGQGKRTAILLDQSGPTQAELMYKMVDYLACSMFDLLGWLGVAD